MGEDASRADRAAPLLELALERPDQVPTPRLLHDLAVAPRASQFILMPRRSPVRGGRSQHLHAERGSGAHLRQTGETPD